MTDTKKTAQLRAEVKDNLMKVILPFWKNNLKDEIHGGFYGKVDGNMIPDLKAPKSVVLNCRLLWTYTRAWKMLDDNECGELARRAFEYIRDKFWDPVYKGAYWMLTADGEAGEAEKRAYGQAFLIYSMAEYYRASGDEQAKALAMETLELMNHHLLLPKGGYADSATRDWQRDEWVNIWVKNRNGDAMLLNSNMHFFEAILSLAEATGDERVIASLRRQLEFILDTVVDHDLHHLKAGMDENGDRTDDEINFGHDAECSYLLVQAAELIGDNGLVEKAKRTAVEIVNQIYEEGMDKTNGGVYYVASCRTGEINRSKIWWVEAEAVTAFFNCYQLTGQEKYLDAAISVWEYIKQNMVNHENGDWYAVGKNQFTDSQLQKQEKSLIKVFSNGEMAGKGKCPYHNSRMCYEIMERTTQYYTAENPLSNIIKKGD